MKFKIPPNVHFTRTTSVEVNINSSSDGFVALVDKPSSPKLQSLVIEAEKGIKQQSPTLVEDGISGTYFLKSESGSSVGVFKPYDEDGSSSYNPKNASNDNSKKVYKDGISTGETSVRECAAYYLDYDHFAGVPETDFVICHHPVFFSRQDSFKHINQCRDSTSSCTSPAHTQLKVGSFQAYTPHQGNLADYGTSEIPIDEVHKIACLDVRIFNMDRHEGNILYQENVDPNTGNDLPATLIPIDHAYCLPSFLTEASFCWQNWHQAKQKMSRRTKDYISKLDAEKDVSLLKEKFPYSFAEDHFNVLRMTTFLLKKAAELDATFHDIANMMCRSELGQLSVLEMIVADAKTKHSQTPEEPFFNIYQELVCCYLLEKTLPSCLD